MAKLTNNFPNKFYQPLFDSAGEGMIVIDERGKIVLANQRVIDLFEYSLDELLGETISILIPKKSKSRHENHVSGYFGQPSKRLMGEANNLSGETKSGRLIPVEISLNYFNDEGRTYAIGVITDITERKKAQDKISELNEQLERKVQERTEQLLASQKLHNTIARNFPEGTINVFDKALNYVFVEGKELFKLGVTSEKLIGSNYIKRLPHSISKNVEAMLMSVFEGETKSMEIEVYENFYVLDAVPLTGKTSEIDQILVFEKNITFQKNIENEMKKSLHKEQELNLLKSRFVSMASHEFRTPLGAILSSATLIGKYKESEQQEKRDKHIKRIKSSVENLTRILNDFLSFDQLESGKINCQPEEFDVQKLCDMVLEDIKGLLKDGQEIECVHEGENSLVVLDKQLLGNIMINLISNAIKYSDVNQRIYLKTKMKKNIMVLTVVDRGMGIPKDEQKHLYERFFRAKNAINIQGTGLGLNIVKKYVELLHGEIDCVSKEGKGTAFTIKLPKKLIL